MDNKKKKTTVALATAAMLLLGGTFAWQGISQTALNEASDVINPGGRLHDDFYIDDNNKYNSNIYVENFADDEIFARVKLEEFMEVAVNRGTDAETITPVTGSKELKDGANVDAENNPSGKDLYDYTYETHYFDQENNSDAYWDWKFGDSSSEQVYYMPTFNKNKDSLAADRNGMYVDRVGGISDRSKDQYEDWSVWGENDTKEDVEIYDADSNQADEIADGSAVLDENYKETLATHTAQPVGATKGLISMSDWLDKLYNDEDTAGYWVYDSDGWVYWSSPIAGGEATGLLLDEIALKQVMDDSWYYAINAVGQFITANDLGRDDNTGFFANGETVSDDALTLLAAIGVNIGEGSEEPEEPEDPYGFSHLLMSFDQGGMQSETFFSKGFLTPGDSIDFGVAAYYNNGEAIEITSDNVEWAIDTVEGELDEGTSITQDGVLSVSDAQADRSVIRVQAIFTDKDGIEHTEEQSILVSLEDVTLTMEVNEEEPYYTDEWYSMTATATNASGESVPMEWQFDIVAANEGEELYADPSGNEFCAYDAGDYYLRAWADYMLGQYAEIPITVTQNPDSESGDEWTDPEPSFSFWIDAVPGGYTPGLSTNNITLSASASFGEETLDAAQVMNWTIVGGNTESETQITDNGDGTAELYIAAGETENIIVSAVYEYDGEVHTAECVIPNHPQVRSMMICDNEGNYSTISYAPGTETEIELTAYAFENYTGMVQPKEDAYTGDAADLIATHLSFYLADGYEEKDVPGVTLTQNGASVKVNIDDTVNEAFSVVCYLDSGMQVNIDITPESE